MGVSAVLVLEGWVQCVYCLHAESGSKSKASQFNGYTVDGVCSRRDRTANEILSEMLPGLNQQKAWVLRSLWHICHWLPGLITQMTHILSFDGQA
jgi:hypothetical protein